MWALHGRSDIFPPRRCTVLLVHGRFWPRHIDCAKSTLRCKRARDWRNIRDLRAAGWRVIVVWECELGAARLERFGRSLVRKVTGRSSGR